MDKRISYVAVLMAALAGCGGAAAVTGPVTVTPDPVITPTPDPDPDPAPSTSSAHARSASALQTGQAGLLVDNTPRAFTDLAIIPTSGGATYAGYISGDLANQSDTITDSVLGQMSLDVTFTSTSVTLTGMADQFYDDDNAALQGSLTFANGSLDRAGDPDADVTLTLTMNGTLTDAQNRDLVIGATLEGDFLGSAYDSIGGDVLGRVNVDGTSQDIDGLFIAER